MLHNYVRPENKLKILDSLQPETAGAVAVGNRITGTEFPGIVKPQGIVAGTAENKTQSGVGQGPTVGILGPGVFIDLNMPAVNKGG